MKEYAKAEGPMRYSETITIEDLDTDPFPHYARLRATDPIAPVPAAN